jgi:hypothetical protein
MNIFNDIYNETEKEDDWGWFIRLDLDNTTPMTNKKTNYICKNLQTIHENQEYHDTTMKTLPTRYTQYKNPVFNIDFMSKTTSHTTPNTTPNTNKNKYFILKTKYDFFKNLLINGLFYNCIYFEYIYKCINPFWCYKQNK